MSVILQTDTAGPGDLTSRIQLASHTASADLTLRLTVRMTGLDTSARATIKLDATIDSGSGEEQGPFGAQPKRVAGDAEWYGVLEVDVQSGDTVRLYAESTNSSDTSVTVTVHWRDALAANPEAWGGDYSADMLTTDGVPDVSLAYVNGQDQNTIGLGQMGLKWFNDSRLKADNRDGEKIAKDIPTTAGQVSDSAPEAKQFTGDSGLSATDDWYNGAYVLFTGGALAGLLRGISDYVGSTRLIKLTSPLPQAPADGDPFEILGRRE